MRGATATATAALAAGLCALPPCIAGCGSSARPPQPSPRPAAQRFLSVDAPAHRARLILALGYDDSASSQNIDGATKGALLFSVPVGWRVGVQCVNRSLPALYACSLAEAPGAPLAQPSLAYVLHPAQGLALGRSAAFGFTPQAAGRYRLVALTRQSGSWSRSAGMWVVLRVSAGGAPQAQWLR
jgi:hypothetical protein